MTAKTKTRLPPVSVALMLGFGGLWQACASGRFAFAAAAWMCLLPLAVFVRAARLPHAILGSFVAVFVGRFVGWVGVVEDAAVAASVASVLTVCALLAHRHVMRELPLVGSFALPAAVVVVEALAGRLDLPGASLLPLSTTQPADVPLWRFVDVLTPLGVSFCVAFGQSVMAGFGESWLAEDPYPQDQREAGLRLGANVCFWGVVVGMHGGGWLRADVAPGTHGDAVAAVAGVGLLAMLLFAIGVRRKRAAASGAGNGGTPPAEAAARA